MNREGSLYNKLKSFKNVIFFFFKGVVKVFHKCFYFGIKEKILTHGL